MSQATPQSIASDLSGTGFRNEANSILAALYSQNSGTTAPSPATPGMLWLDTSATPAVLKLRNAADTAWVAVVAETVAAKSVRGNSGGSAAAVGSIDMPTLATMLGFASVVADPGYVTLPGGLIIQWGGTSAILAGGGQAVTFPLAFPTGVFRVLATPITSANNTSGFSVGARSATTTGFTATNNSGTSGSVTAAWAAFGY